MGKYTEFTDFITTDGEVYAFDSTDRFLVSEEGLGMPPIEYIVQSSPFQHGETVVGYRLKARTIQLLHRRNSCSRDAYWASRANLIDILRPNRGVYGTISTGILRRTLSNGVKRCINVMIDQGPVFVSRSMEQWDEWSYQETIRFIAHDPTFYDPVEVSTNYPFNPENQLQFSFSFPFILYSPAGIGTNTWVTNSGTWIVYPRIVLTGPMEGIDITNMETNERIRLNYSIKEGEVVTINLAPGSKTVTNAAGTNLIGAISSDSNLSTFHLEPAPAVTGGANRMYIGCTGTNGVSSIDFKHYNRYIGI